MRRQSGLPAEVSSLVGRGPEIAAVRERLRVGRVVTLTGPGGCGKTRLALRVAALAEPGFHDGARLVELAPLTDPALVPASVAQALGVSERDAPTPTAGLVRELAGRELLVVLDNCEHVLAAAAGLAAVGRHQAVANGAHPAISGAIICSPHDHLGRHSGRHRNVPGHRLADGP